MDLDFSIQNIKKIYLGGEPIDKIIKKYKFELKDFNLYTSNSKEIKEKNQSTLPWLLY